LEPKIEPLDEDDRAASAFVDNVSTLQSVGKKRPRAPKTGPPLDDDDAMTMLSCPLDRPPPQRAHLYASLQRAKSGLLEPKPEPMDEDEPCSSNSLPQKRGHRSTSIGKAQRVTIKAEPMDVDDDDVSVLTCTIKKPLQITNFELPASFLKPAPGSARRGRSSTTRAQSGLLKPKAEPVDEDETPSSKISTTPAGRGNSTGKKGFRAPKPEPLDDDDDVASVLTCPLDRPPPQRVFAIPMSLQKPASAPSRRGKTATTRSQRGPIEPKPEPMDEDEPCSSKQSAPPSKRGRRSLSITKGAASPGDLVPKEEP
ncbi:hypothetical protein PMAYCL1PPCAC_25675, partial [Pristionchus mayeri]